MQNWDLTLNEWINISLTIAILIAVSAQALFTRRQAQILRQSELWTQERDKPRLQITRRSQAIIFKDLNRSTKKLLFEEFTVTNSGFFDVEITEFAFETGKIISNGDNDSLIAFVEFQPSPDYNLKNKLTMSLPHRLRYGESFQVSIDIERLVRESTRVGGTSPVNMRPYCRDSLGNIHRPNFWIVYQDDNDAVYAKGPSPGRVSEEEWEKLSDKEQRRYKWKRIFVAKQKRVD